MDKKFDESAKTAKIPPVINLFLIVIQSKVLNKDKNKFYDNTTS